MNCSKTQNPPLACTVAPNNWRPASPQTKDFSVVPETRTYSQTHTDSAGTLCSVLVFPLEEWLCVSRWQMWYVFWIRRKTFQCGKKHWAFNQWFLPAWGIEGSEAPHCVSKLIKAFTYRKQRCTDTHAHCVQSCTKIHAHTHAQCSLK